MKRKDMEVGMPVEYWDFRNWRPGIIHSMPSGDLPELVVIKTPPVGMLKAKFDDQIELPGTAHKEQP